MPHRLVLSQKYRLRPYCALGAGDSTVNGATPAFLAQARVFMHTPDPSLIPGSFCPGWGWTCDLQRDCLLSLKFTSFFIKSLSGRLTALIYGHSLCQTGRSDGTVNIPAVMCLAAFGVPSSMLPPLLTTPLLPQCYLRPVHLGRANFLQTTPN